MMKCLDTFLSLVSLHICDVLDTLHARRSELATDILGLQTDKLTSVVSIFNNLSSAFPRMSKILTSP